MFHSVQRRQNLAQGIFSLWVNWAISLGFIMLPIIIAPLVTIKILPILPLISAGVLTLLDRLNRQHKQPTCFRIPHITQIILMASALTLLIDMLYKCNTEMNSIIGQPANKLNPVLPILDIAPVAVIVCLVGIIRAKSPMSCRSCKNRLSEALDSGQISKLYFRETTRQLHFLFWLSLALSITTWWYYLSSYINVNINSSDTYFFLLCPSLCFVLSLIYFGIRYYTLWAYYCNNKATADVVERHGTTLRYIVVCDDKILLNVPEHEMQQSAPHSIDVALKVSIPFKERVTDQEAHDFVVNALDSDDNEVRFLFHSCDPGMYSNIFHYAVFVNNADHVANKLNGQWLTLSDTNDMISEGKVSMALATELSHIYTVTMAWKAYDSRGHRLYEIKHYKPTFRIKDMPSWDVDYDDPNWLYVAELNEDKPLYRVRRLWHRITKGTGRP